MFSLNCLSQQTESITLPQIEKKVAEFYLSKNHLCYIFKEIRGGNLYPEVLTSHGNVNVYKENDSIYYKSTHSYDLEKLKDYKYETVKNPLYFGTNHLKEKFFRNYKLLPLKKRYYAFKYSPDDILKPDTFLKSVFSRSNYFATLKKNKAYFSITLTDTGRKGSVDHVNPKNKHYEVFYISKIDYSILKHAIYNSWVSGDLVNQDSIIYTYTYYHESLKEIKAFVNDFTPFAEKVPYLKLIVMTRLKSFPNFIL